MVNCMPLCEIPDTGFRIFTPTCPDFSGSGGARYRFYLLSSTSWSAPAYLAGKAEIPTRLTLRNLSGLYFYPPLEDYLLSTIPFFDISMIKENIKFKLKINFIDRFNKTANFLR